MEQVARPRSSACEDDGNDGRVELGKVREEGGERGGRLEGGKRGGSSTGE